jgi:hypothetical protein
MSLKQKIRNKAEGVDSIKKFGWKRDHPNGQVVWIDDVNTLLNEATKQIQEKAYCPLIDYRNATIAYSPKTNEPYLASGFNPCLKRTCATCTIRNQHLVVKHSDVMSVLEGAEQK